MDSNTDQLSAQQIIELLGLQRHPEGGWFSEMYRDPSQRNERSVGTAIYYLLEQGERSHWHKVDAAEIWHYYAGAPLQLAIADENGPAVVKTLGVDLISGERPQIVVPKSVWQSAKSLGIWTLVGCTVAPGFEFSGFEMAPSDWAPRN